MLVSNNFKNSQHFIELEGSLPCSHFITNRFYGELLAFTPNPQTGGLPFVGFSQLAYERKLYYSDEHRDFKGLVGGWKLSLLLSVTPETEINREVTNNTQNYHWMGQAGRIFLKFS